MGSKILTVDDSRTVRAIIKKLFADMDCQVLEAEDGIEGLAQAGRHLPDLIILDIDMPRMNGLDMLAHLRKNDRFKTTPVFMLTSKSKEKNIKLASEYEAQAFIAKPFKRDDLLQKVRQFIELA